MYSINKVAADFVAATNGIDLLKFQDDVWVNATITTLLLGVKTTNDGANLEFIFDSEPSAPEKTEFDTLVAAHTGSPAALTAVEEAQEAAKSAIDVAAGSARARYVTVTPGQAEVYVEKGKQAQEFKDASYPADETGYEFITAEKNAQGVTATVAADTILATAAGWKAIAANIEEIRLDYKNQVGAELADVKVIKALGNKAIALLNAI